MARAPSLPWVELTPVSDTHFAYISTECEGKITEVSITFQSEAGQVTGLEYDEGKGTKLGGKKLPEIVSAFQATQAASTPSLFWLLAAALLLLGALLIGVMLWRRAPSRVSK